MTKRPSSISFSWEGTDNPNDPEGVAEFFCDGIKVRAAFNDFVTASKISYLLYAAYERGKNDAIDRAQSTISRLLDEQRYD
jgi:hypothetical protein